MLVTKKRHRETNLYPYLLSNEHPTQSENWWIIRHNMSSNKFKYYWSKINAQIFVYWIYKCVNIYTYIRIYMSNWITNESNLFISNFCKSENLTDSNKRIRDPLLYTAN